MANFYHIFIQPKQGITPDTVKQKMDLAIDWFRYTPNNWIVYTSSDQDKWLSRLRPLVEPDGSLFICKLDISGRNGWMSKEFWDWIRSRLN